MTEDELKDLPLRTRGRQYEDFELGQTFVHHWGRTLTETDNTLFSTLTLHFNPTYFNAEYAKAIGYPRSPLNPLLVFNTVVGLSVEDLSEGCGPFLGVDKLAFRQPAYPGDTLVARSTVVAKRESDSKAGMGILTWHTEGVNQRGEVVVEYERSNLAQKRGGAR